LKDAPPIQDLVIGADAVDSSGEHQALVVRGVAGQKIREAVVDDCHGDVMRRVTGSRHYDDITGLGETPAGREGTERFGGDVERNRIEP